MRFAPRNVGATGGGKEFHWEFHRGSAAERGAGKIEGFHAPRRVYKYQGGGKRAGGQFTAPGSKRYPDLPLISR